MYNIFIVEDHPIIRQGYVALINREADMTVCGEAVSATEAVQRLPAIQPDLVIVDISLGDSSGLDLLKQLQEIAPQVPAVVVSGHDESVYGEAVLQLGAKGYITKESPHLFIATIRRVLQEEAQAHPSCKDNN